MLDKWKILYFGLDPSRFLHDGTLTHLPLIEIVPKPLPFLKKSFKNCHLWTHVLFTSQTTVSLFFDVTKEIEIEINTSFLAVGAATQKKIEAHGNFHIDCAENESAEGVIELLETLDLHNSFLFMPHSGLARPLIKNYLREKQIPFESKVFYDTRTRMPDKKINLEEFDEFVFTSPTTVDAYVKIFGALPKNKKLTSIGPVTQKRMDKFLRGDISLVH